MKEVAILLLIILVFVFVFVLFLFLIKRKIRISDNSSSETIEDNFPGFLSERTMSLINKKESFLKEDIEKVIIDTFCEEIKNKKENNVIKVWKNQEKYEDYYNICSKFNWNKKPLNKKECYFLLLDLTIFISENQNVCPDKRFFILEEKFFNEETLSIILLN